MSNAGLVYLLDDNADTLESVALLLQLNGVATRCGNCGKEALDDLRSAGASKAIIDLSMPGRDGFSVARDIRADTSVRDTLLIAYSAFVDRDTIEQCRKAGFDYFLMKPCDPEALLACIRQEALSTLPAGCAECARALSFRVRQQRKQEPARMRQIAEKATFIA